MKHNTFRTLLFFFNLMAMGISFAQTSTLVSLDTKGRLVYAPDAKGNKIPDFERQRLHRNISGTKFIKRLYKEKIKGF